MKRNILLFLVLSLSLLNQHIANAMTVHDPISYIRLGEQLSVFRNQLTQMTNQLQAMTGNKGFGAIGIEKERHYLPDNWNQAMHLLDESNPYAELTQKAQDIKNANRVLSEEELNQLSPEVKERLKESRNNAAIQEALSQMSYQKAQSRLQVLQELVDGVSKTQDAKAALDLQARIQSEQAMLQNEAIKVANLQQLLQTQKESLKVNERELLIKTSGTGNFPRLRP